MDELYKHLDDVGAKFMTLVEKPTGDKREGRQFGLFNETNDKSGSILTDPFVPPTPDAKLTTSLHREHLELQSDQEMMVALAYSLPQELSQFQLYHLCTSC